ncbi:MAG: glycosyltransferase [Candidatus Schekmanbacteria bacterium]|nr:glycosyltransferase [Candidatus Schekmanbacteria bacterium]
MIAGHDIICFANDWDSDPLSKKHIMVRLAKANRVLWVDSIGVRRPRATARDARRVASKLRRFLCGVRRVEANIHVLSPLALPLHDQAWAQRLNGVIVAESVRGACRRLGFREPISWVFTPTCANIAGALDEALIVYHCVDEYTEFTGTDAAAVGSMERELMNKADLVVVSSAPLLAAKREANPYTYLVQHGVDVAHFRQACMSTTEMPADLAAIPRPRLGFHGLIADWIDLALLADVARARPDWSIVLLGKIDTDPSAVAALPNVHLMGPRPYGWLPSYCKGFDVALVPFVVNDLTVAANPLKVREYLAAGLPVVSTALPEVERLGELVRIARRSDDFVGEIAGLLEEGDTGPRPWVSRRMDSESWDARVRELSALVVAALGRARPAEGAAVRSPVGVGSPRATLR